MYEVSLSEAYFPAQEEPGPNPITIGEMLRRSAADFAENVALVEVDGAGGCAREWTYAELVTTVQHLAAALSARHEAGARVAVYANNVPEWILLELACTIADIILVTVNPASQERELQFILTQSRSEALYFIEEFRGNPLGQIARAVCKDMPHVRMIDMADEDAFFKIEDEPATNRAPTPESACQIQYTSGTTGVPKGALLKQNSLVQNATAIMNRIGLKAGMTLVNTMPLFHTSGCGIVTLGGLSVGITIYLPPMFDPVSLATLIERENIQFLPCVPTMLVALMAHVSQSGQNLKSVQRIMSGGAMVAPELCRQAEEVIGAPIQIVYGQTETSPVITQVWADDSVEDQSQTVGQPLPNVEVAIKDPVTNKILPIGEQGEICARGYLLMLEYNDNPKATADTIDSDGWLHTGDLGRMDKRGYVQITGRVKEMIIRGGENLFPAEIENAVLEHPLVDEVAVVGIPDDVWGEQVACFMRTDAGERPSDEELKTFLRERISPQKTPTYWTWVDEWPLTGSGKIQKFKLRDDFKP